MMRALSRRHSAMTLTSPNKTVSRDVFSCNHGLEQEAIFRVFCGFQVGNAWRQQVRWKLDKYWNTIPSLFFKNILLDRRQRRVWY